MNAELSQLHPTGKGFVVAPVGDGLPIMRRLVESYTGKNKKTACEFLKVNYRTLNSRLKKD
ncbi:MAG: hypothetical protein KKA76_17550 [Proteobacteria bacterium]|nr:hypothetical protein [Pseudomonadota bacterium]